MDLEVEDLSLVDEETPPPTEEEEEDELLLFALLLPLPVPFSGAWGV